MKKLFLLLAVFAILLVATGCKKEQGITSDNTATFNVINGIVNNTALIKMNGQINNSGIYGGGTQGQIYFGSNLFFFGEAKNTDVSVLNSTDSSVFVTKNIDFKKGGIYTMLLAGIAPNVDAVVVDDSNIPKIDLGKTPSDADSIMYVRFINLAPDISSIDVRIQGAAAYEVTALPYKAASAWKSYPAKIANGTFTKFEFVQNGTVVGVVTAFFSLGRFKNRAFVLTGRSPSMGSPGLAVNAVNYYQ